MCPVPWSHALLCQLLCWILCPVVSNYLTLIIDIHNLSTEDKFNLNIWGKCLLRLQNWHTDIRRFRMLQSCENSQYLKVERQKTVRSNYFVTIAGIFTIWDERPRWWVGNFSNPYISWFKTTTVSIWARTLTWKPFLDKIRDSWSVLGPLPLATSYWDFRICQLLNSFMNFILFQKDDKVFYCLRNKSNSRNASVRKHHK